jgi:hypothetical protein
MGETIYVSADEEFQPQLAASPRNLDYILFLIVTSNKSLCALPTIRVTKICSCELREIWS